MITERNTLFLKTIRVLREKEDVRNIFSKKSYDYETVISYEPLGLEADGFSLKQKKVLNIPLSPDIQTVFERFHRTTRNEIQKTHNIPELEFKIGDDNYEGTYRLYCRFERAQGRVPWKRHAFMHKVLLANAYFRGKLIVAVPTYTIPPYLQVMAISSARHQANLDHWTYRVIGFATRRLIYELAHYGMREKYEMLGLGAITDATAQKSAVSQFKMGFGGVSGDEYTYTRMSKRFARMLALKKLLRI